MCAINAVTQWRRVVVQEARTDGFQDSRVVKNDVGHRSGVHIRGYDERWDAGTAVVHGLRVKLAGRRLLGKLRIVEHGRHIVWIVWIADRRRQHVIEESAVFVISAD